MPGNHTKGVHVALCRKAPCSQQLWCSKHSRPRFASDGRNAICRHCLAQPKVCHLSASTSVPQPRCPYDSSNGMTLIPGANPKQHIQCKQLTAHTQQLAYQNFHRPVQTLKYFHFLCTRIHALHPQATPTRPNTTLNSWPIHACHHPKKETIEDTRYCVKH